jgi:hypothetical protein
MVETVKFSEFPSGTLAQDVGLAASGLNARGPSTSGNDPEVIEIIDQDVTGLAVNRAVRMNSAGLYVLALADNPQNAEVVGIVREIVTPGVSGQFKLQQSGTIPPGTPGFSGFNPEEIYYLSDTSLGVMTTTEPTANGSVSKPCLEATGADSAKVICLQRGKVIGFPGPITAGGPGPNDDKIVKTLSSANGFMLGDFIRVSGEQAYGLADATNFAQSQSIGAVITTGNPVFTVQFCGYATNVVTGAVDATGAPIPMSPSTFYYLSETMPGKICPTKPLLPGSYAKPVYICDSVANATGWILPQISLPKDISTPGASPLIFCGVLNAANNFSSQTILQDANGNTYKSYQLIFNNGTIVGGNYGIRATGAAPNVGIGLQFFGTTWSTTNDRYASYISGVNSTAGIDTATWWGSVANGGAIPERTYAQILKPTSRAIVMVGGNGIISSTTNNLGNGALIIDCNFLCVDSEGFPPGAGIGYTCVGNINGVTDTLATGLRVAILNGTIDLAASPGYISVWAIPNS